MLFGTFLIIPQAYSSTTGEEWNSIKSSLSDAEKSKTQEDVLLNIESAITTYENVFKKAALEVDPESNFLIENAFSDSIDRLSKGEVEQASLNKQIVDKTIYKIAFMKMELAVDNDDVSDFLYWYDVMEKKFSISTNDYESKNLIADLKSNPDKISEHGSKITEEILGIFKLKTIEELEEAIAALENNDLSSAKKFTYEGLYYYRTLHPAIEDKLGQETADELLHEMEEALEITTSGKPESEILNELKNISSEVELIIRQYEGGNISELGLALSGIKDRLSLVNVEYVDAVKDGKIINQEEYDETIVFLSKARDIFNQHRTSIEKLSSPDSSSLEKNFVELDSIISNKGDPSKVSTLVDKSLDNLDSLQEYSGSEVQIEAIQYIDKIEILLNQAKKEYREGNSQKAFDLVTEAYLDNYEFVEEPLGEVDPKLMVKIEINMREELRNMIKSGVPNDQVEAHIDMILEDLSNARKVVPEFGTIALMVLAVSIISIVFVSSKSSLALKV